MQHLIVSLVKNTMVIISRVMKVVQNHMVTFGLNIFVFGNIYRYNDNTYINNYGLYRKPRVYIDTLLTKFTQGYICTYLLVTFDLAIHYITLD